MIVVSVNSDFMEATRLFRSDTRSISYLKKVKKLHLLILQQKAGLRPKRSTYHGAGSLRRYQNDLHKWQAAASINNSNIKVEIEHFN